MPGENKLPGKNKSCREKTKVGGRKQVAGKKQEGRKQDGGKKQSDFSRIFYGYSPDFLKMIPNGLIRRDLRFLSAGNFVFFSFPWYLNHDKMCKIVKQKYFCFPISKFSITVSYNPHLAALESSASAYHRSESKQTKVMSRKLKRLTYSLNCSMADTNFTYFSNAF